MSAPDTRIATVTLTFANGWITVRSYRVDDPWPEWIADPPAFLTDLRKDWPVPGEPIQYTARVDVGFEQEARDLLAFSREVQR